jgi:hypothetical protein
MKNILFLLFAICITACTNNTSVIKGTLPSDSYDNEWVYWVPMEGTSAKTVDSTRIRKNAFRLAISAHNRNKTGIVRVKPLLRFALQDILVFTEAGTVHVKLDSVSSAAGTPLNEVLQNWKDKKRTYDKEIYALRKKRRATGANDETGIKEEIEKVSATYYNDTYQIIVENKANEVGKFLYSLHKSFFTPEQIRELGIEK